MTPNPRQTGRDSLYQSTSALLTEYDTQIVKYYIDKAVLPKFLGSRNLNQPALHTLNWMVNTRPKRPSTSMYGDDDNVGNIGYDTETNNFVVTNQSYHLNYYQIQEALRSGYMIDNLNPAETGLNIAREVDYICMNGNTTPALTGILSTTGVTDAGAPTGAWDTTSNAYNDLLAIVDAVRNKGYMGTLNMLATQGIKKIMYRFIGDGTDTFPVTVEQWVKDTLLNGGEIYYSSSPFTANSGPSTTDANTGTDGTAVNKVLVAAPEAADIVYAHGLQSIDRPAKSNEIYRDVFVKYTVQVKQPYWIAFMDAIDATG